MRAIAAAAIAFLLVLGCTDAEKPAPGEARPGAVPPPAPAAWPDAAGKAAAPAATPPAPALPTRADGHASGGVSQRPAGIYTKSGIRQESPPGADRKPDHEAGSLVFEDTFDRAEFGTAYTVVGGDWRIEGGAVHSTDCRNQNLWLNKPLPRNARIELTAWSQPPEVDTKFIVYGDGRNHYTGHILIIGGWGNSLSIMSRGNEHGLDRLERTRTPLEPDGRWKSERKYHHTVVRNHGETAWYIDDVLFLVYDDPAPLAGDGNDRFGFSNWRAKVFFDDLRIFDLDAKAP